MEDWSRGHIVLAIGALINSALYLSATALASFAFGHKTGMLLAIAAMGVAFLGYSFQLTWGPTPLAKTTSFASQLLGVCAGIALILEVYM